MSTNPFKINNPLVDQIRNLMMTEDMKKLAIISAPPNSLSLNYVDISDPNSPVVVFKGAGTMPYAYKASYVKEELSRIAGGDGHGYGMNKLLNILTDIDGQKRSGKLFMHYLQGFAEAERVIESPSGKAKITKAKSVLAYRNGVDASIARNKANNG